MVFDRAMQTLFIFGGQRDDKYLKHLPYSGVIDAEAYRQFQEIKTHLGLCITNREIGLPLKFWLNRLYW